MHKKPSSVGIKQQRQEILKRGLIGIVCVLALAFAVSFIGGEDNQQSKNDTSKSDETTTLDTDALLNGDTQQPVQNAQQIPASRRFDYQGGGDASAPIAPSSENVANNQQPAVSDDPSSQITTLPAKDGAPVDAFMEEGPAYPNNDTIEKSVPDTEPTTTMQSKHQVQDTPAASSQPDKTPSSATEQQPTSTKASLYCGSYPSSAKAEEQKAIMAFQGLSSTVVRYKGVYSLKLGPYKNRDRAKAAFNDLDAKGLVTECSLENE